MPFLPLLTPVHLTFVLNEHATHHTVKKKKKTGWDHPKKLTMNTAQRKSLPHMHVPLRLEAATGATGFWLIVRRVGAADLGLHISSCRTSTQHTTLLREKEEKRKQDGTIQRN